MHIDRRAPSPASWMHALMCMFALWAASGLQARAQEPDGWSPRTGDAWLDATLVDVNRYADKHRGAFVDELVRYQAAPRALAEESLDADVAAGDVYFACAAAQALGRPCRELLDARRGSGGEDWQAVVRRIDSAQAPTALQRVKRGVAESYVHWARPLPADAPATRTRGQRGR